MILKAVQKRTVRIVPVLVKTKFQHVDFKSITLEDDEDEEEYNKKILYHNTLTDHSDIEHLGYPLLNMGNEECISMPGTPASSTEDSSIGSQCSSHMLLPIPSVDDKVQIESV